MNHCALFVTAALSLAGGVAAQRMIGVSFNGTLVTIDPTTGIGSPLGSLGFSGAGGLGRIDDVVFTNGNGGGLWKINPWTGAATAGPPISSVLDSIRAMATNRLGELFVIQNGGGPIGTSTPDLLYVTSTAGGSTWLVGSTSGFTAIQGLAFSPSEVLYGWDTTAGLVQISPATGVTTDVNPAVGATVDIQGLTFSPSGVLYGARHNLYTIHLTTGVPTLVGTGGYSDLRGIEFTQGPRIYDNGPLVTHPGGGYAGGDLSMVQTSLGLTVGGWVVDASQGMHLIDDFQTNGSWSVDALEFLFWKSNSSALTDVRLAIYDNPPQAGGVEVPGSPGMQVNLLQQPGYLVTYTLTSVFRATETSPLSFTRRIHRLRVQLATPLNLASASLPSGRYWLRWSLDAGTAVLGIPPVSTRGFSSPGNALSANGQQFAPLTDGGQSQALPFAFYGTAAAPAAGVTNLGGGCGAGAVSLDVRGATCAGGAVMHELVGAGSFPGIILGFTDPNLPFAPLCGCVQHASLDFFVFGTATYTLVAPPGVGTGFEYYAQGVQLAFGAAGLPCHLGPAFDVRLTDAYRVRFW